MNDNLYYSKTHLERIQKLRRYQWLGNMAGALIIYGVLIVAFWMVTP